MDRKDLLPCILSQGILAKVQPNIAIKFQHGQGFDYPAFVPHHHTALLVFFHDARAYLLIFISQLLKMAFYSSDQCRGEEPTPAPSAGNASSKPTLKPPRNTMPRETAGKPKLHPL